jgi:hypothetical protein
MLQVEYTITSGAALKGVYNTPADLSGDKMFEYTYTDLYRAADILWPGEADSILDNPTDEQIRMIVAALDSSPVVRLRWDRDALSNQTTTF